MKTIRLLAILIIFSLQASATGYVHNMFVAHKKLQSGKEAPAEKVIARKAKIVAKPKHLLQVKQATVLSQPMTQVAVNATLNERILEEGPASFFSTEKEEDDETMVAKLVSAVRCVIYAFIGTPKFGNS